MRRFATVILVIATALYPVLVYVGVDHFSTRVMGGLLLLLLLTRLMFGLANSRNNPLRGLLPVLCLFALTLMIFDRREMLLWYPVLVSVLMLGVFVYTLWMPPPIIERIARLTEPDLPVAAVHYTRKVTVVWCVFFAVNAAIATTTVLWTDFETWALYNGLISYLLMGSLFAAEFLLRRRLQGKAQSAR